MVMVRTGQAAQRIKKETDAKPKVGFKKLAKDAALNAAMIVGPGKFVKGAKVAEQGAVAAARLARRARGGSGTASRMQKASKSTDASRREAKRRAENAAKETRVEKAEVPSPSKVVKLAPRKPQPASETFRVAQRNIRRNVAGVDKPKAKISDKMAAAAAKDASRRPIAPRPRDVKKPGNYLTPREKLYESLGKKAPVKVTRKKPMRQVEIATAKKSEKETRWAKRAETPAKPKGGKLEDKNFKLPKHKVNVGTPKIVKKETPKKLKVTRPARGNKTEPADIVKGRPTGWKNWSEPKKQRWLEKRDRQRDTAAAKANPNRYSGPKKETGNRLATERNLEIGLTGVKKTMQKNEARFAKKNAAKVDATLAKAKRARQGRSLQNTFNKPIFKRKPSTGKLTVKRPIKPTKE
jgi:hypothetical protein